MTAVLVAAPLWHAPLELKWLQGSWRAHDTKHALITEELWVCSEAGLTGLHREVLEGKAGFYELTTVVTEGDTLVSTRMFDRALKDQKKTAAGPLRFTWTRSRFTRRCSRERARTRGRSPTSCSTRTGCA